MNDPLMAEKRASVAMDEWPQKLYAQNNLRGK